MIDNFPPTRQRTRLRSAGQEVEMDSLQTQATIRTDHSIVRIPTSREWSCWMSAPTSSSESEGAMETGFSKASRSHQVGQDGICPQGLQEQISDTPCRHPQMYILPRWCQV